MGTAPPPEPPVRANTSVDIVMEIAVIIDAIVMPCSRKRVLIRSPRVLSSCSIRSRVSRIRFICERAAFLVTEMASRRPARSSRRSESSRSRAVILFFISCLILSSFVSVNYLRSRARWSSFFPMFLSSSESLATLFVYSPRNLSRAR